MFQSLIPVLLKIAQDYIYFKRFQNGSYFKNFDTEFHKTKC